MHATHMHSQAGRAGSSWWRDESFTWRRPSDRAVLIVLAMAFAAIALNHWIQSVLGRM